jgi:hypothetical protein
MASNLPKKCSKCEHTLKDHRFKKGSAGQPGAMPCKLCNCDDFKYQVKETELIESETQITEGNKMKVDEGRKSLRQEEFEKTTGSKMQKLCSSCNLPVRECMCEAKKVKGKLKEAIRKMILEALAQKRSIHT